MAGLAATVFGVDPSIPGDVVKDIICLYGTHDNNFTQAALPSARNAIIAASTYMTGGMDALAPLAREIGEPNYGAIGHHWSGAMADNLTQSQTTETALESETETSAIETQIETEATTTPPASDDAAILTYHNGDVELTGEIHFVVSERLGEYYLFELNKPIDVIGDFGEVYHTTDMEIFFDGTGAANDPAPYVGQQVRISGELVGMPTTGARARDVYIRPSKYDVLD